MLDEKMKSILPEKIQRRLLRIEISPLSIFHIIMSVAAVWMLVHLLPVLLVLVGALMIVGTLNPAVQWLEEHNIKRGKAIAIVFSVLLLVIVLLSTLTLPSLGHEIMTLIQDEPRIRAKLVDVLSRYRLTSSLAHMLHNLQYEALIKSSSAQLFALSTRLFEIVAYSAGAVFLALYIMIDRDRLRGALFSMVPRSHHVRLSRILIGLETIVGGYLRGQAVTCLLMGIFLFVLLMACGIPNALAFAVFGGIADVLPFVGIFLTMGPVLLITLSKGPAIVATVFIVLLCYEEFESRVLIPIVYGRALRLPSSVVLFSLITGGTLGGIIGALLALPVAATILMLFDELRVEMPGEESKKESQEIKTKDELFEAEYERRTEGMSAEEAAAVAVEISNSRKREEEAMPEKPTK